MTTGWQPCPACSAMGLGPFAMAMHLARRHPDWEPTTAGFTAPQLEQIARTRADTLRIRQEAS